MRSKVRVRFVGDTKIPYENNTFYDIDIRQVGEVLKVKHSQDIEKPFKTLVEFENLDKFLDKFTIAFKYIL